MEESHVLITGAAKGIGRASALYLAEKGFRVWAGVRKQADADELMKASKGSLTPIILDVTNAQQIDLVQTTLQDQLGNIGLAGLVNNAGIATAAPLEYLPIVSFRHQLEVNLVGQVAMIQACLPLLRRAKGRIINISSIGGRIAGGMIGAYHASKFGLEAVSDTLRLELRPSGIKVICIEPGAIATPIWETSSQLMDDLLTTQHHEIMQVYGVPINNLRQNASQMSQRGIDPIYVAQVIEKALTYPNPRARYLVGRDAKIVANTIARFPAGLRDWLMARTMWTASKT